MIFHNIEDDDNEEVTGKEDSDQGIRHEGIKYGMGIRLLVQHKSSLNFLKYYFIMLYFRNGSTTC